MTTEESCTRIATIVEFGIKTRLGHVPYRVAMTLLLRVPDPEYLRWGREVYDVCIDTEGLSIFGGNQYTGRLGFVSKQAKGWVRKPDVFTPSQTYYPSAQEAAIALGIAWAKRLASATWEEYWRLKWDRRRGRASA